MEVIGLQTAIKRTVNAICPKNPALPLMVLYSTSKKATDACSLPPTDIGLPWRNVLRWQQGTEELHASHAKWAMVHMDGPFIDSPFGSPLNVTTCTSQQAGDPHEILARKLTGNFPDYERVLPKDYPNSVDIPLDELKHAHQSSSAVCG